MVTLLYHARAVGPICRRIAEHFPKDLKAISDRNLPDRLEGTIIRWDSRDEVQGDLTLNTADAVKLSRNKRESRVRMGDLCPPTWTDRTDLQYPCLIRPQRHYGAHKFFVCTNGREALEARNRCGRGWYASPVVDKKLEYRVFIFQGHALKVVRRFHDEPDEVAWNIANGGRSARLKRESWPIESVKLAIKAGSRLELDWYAADVIVDKDDKPYVLELNTAPGLQRDTTMENFAKVFKWAGEHDVPTVNNLRGKTWQSLIHPALQ